MSNLVDLNSHDVVILRGIPVALTSDLGRAFTVDCARNAERLISDDDLRTKYGISNKAWQRLEENKALLLAVRAARDRRIRSGEAAQEAATAIFAEAPSVLSNSPRHGTGSRPRRTQ
jgi:hypothetical protein